MKSYQYQKINQAISNQYQQLLPSIFKIEELAFLYHLGWRQLPKLLAY